MTQFGGSNKIFTLMPEFLKMEVTLSGTLGLLNRSNPQPNLGSSIE